MRNCPKFCLLLMAALAGCSKGSEQPASTPPAPATAANVTPAAPSYGAPPRLNSPSIIPTEAIPTKPAKSAYGLDLFIAHPELASSKEFLTSANEEAKSLKVNLTQVLASDAPNGQLVIAYGCTSTELNDLAVKKIPILAVVSSSFPKAICAIDVDWGQGAFSEAAVATKSLDTGNALVFTDQSPESAAALSGFQTSLSGKSALKVAVNRVSAGTAPPNGKSNADVILATSTAATEIALQQEPKSGVPIPIYGTNLNSQQEAMLKSHKSGLRAGTVANPSALARTAVDAAVKYLNKEALAKSILVPAGLITG